MLTVNRSKWKTIHCQLREVTNEKGDHMRFFILLWFQELHSLFSIIVGKVLRE